VEESIKPKKAQLTLTNPRDAKPCQKFLQFEVVTSSSQVGNPVSIVINIFLIKITSTYSRIHRVSKKQAKLFLL